MLLYILLIFFVAVALGLAWFMSGHDRGQKEPIGALWLAAGFGLLGGVAAAFLEGLVVPKDVLLPGSTHGSLFLATLWIGLIEEVCKFLPLAIFIYPKKFFNEHTDGVIYFAIVGLGFGLPENILYTVQFGAQTGLGRVLLTPFFHAAITGIVGYWLARNKLAGKRIINILPILLAAILLHAFYDFGMTAGIDLLNVASIAIALLLSAGLFYFFVRATELDQDLGLSVVGQNSFCRTCGKPNPQHHLYCAFCGNNA
jgi:RsiW-degrading membrane proteinase PrsW (M82 family)